MMNTHLEPLNPLAELRHLFGVMRLRVIKWREPRLAPWLNVAEAILDDERAARGEALKALDALQIETNPTAHTDALYTQLRDYLTAAFLVGLIVVGILFFNTDARAKRGRERSVARVVRVMNRNEI